MFEITENYLISTGIVKYKDEFGNTAFMRKTPTGFIAKIRFDNKNVTADVMEVVTIGQIEDGQTLHVKYLDGKNHEHESAVRCGIESFTKLVQRWVYMMHDIKFLEFNDNYLLNLPENQGATKENAAQLKLSNLAKYEELKEVIQVIDRN